MKSSRGLNIRAKDTTFSFDILFINNKIYILFKTSSNVNDDTVWTTKISEQYEVQLSSEQFLKSNTQLNYLLLKNQKFNQNFFQHNFSGWSIQKCLAWSWKCGRSRTLDRILCQMVTSGILFCHFSLKGYCSLGWPWISKNRQVGPSWSTICRLFALWKIHSHF